MSEACFTAADILLPAAGVPLDPWACIAVDQFTSQPEYWQRAEHLADGKPSTLHIVLPEAYLGTPQEAERLESIRRTMEEYRKTVLTRKVHGYVYVERTQMDGTVRQGLVGAVDLDAYDYAKGSKPAIRPSESTVVERIPPRLKVRRGATLETPHVMITATIPMKGPGRIIWISMTSTCWTFAMSPLPRVARAAGPYCFCSSKVKL